MQNLISVGNQGKSAHLNLFKIHYMWAIEVRVHIESYAKSTMSRLCLFGIKRRINPCGSLASDVIKLNMIWMECDQVKATRNLLRVGNHG